MSELSEPRWSVLSERGVEAASLTYLVAKEMFARLSDEGLHGLCVVTDEAGGRVATVSNQTQNLKKTIDMEKL